MKLNAKESKSAPLHLQQRQMVEHAKSSTLNAIIIHLISRFAPMLFSDLHTVDQSVHITQHEGEIMLQNPLKSTKWLQAVGTNCITSHMSTSGSVGLADPGGEEVQLRQRGGGSPTHGALNRNQTAACAAFSAFWSECLAFCPRMLMMPSKCEWLSLRLPHRDVDVFIPTRNPRHPSTCILYHCRMSSLHKTKQQTNFAARKRK